MSASDASGAPRREMFPEWRRHGLIGELFMKVNVYGFLGLLAAGVVLGVPLPVSAHPTAIVHGATVLLIPAGVQALAGCVARLLGAWPFRRDVPIDRTVLAVFSILGLALLGAGVVSVAPATGWRLLLLPFLVGGEVMVVRALAHPGQRAALQERSTRHGGAAWSAQATIGLLIVMLLGLALIVWSLGLTTLS